MAQIEIRTEKGSLDLFDGAEREFYVTRQINDLHNFESRNADYSKTINVPPTPKNVEILDAYVGVEGDQTVPCQIIMGSITVAPRARLLFNKRHITNQEISYDVTVLYGNFNLFDDILEGNINEMSWADLAYEHTHPNYATFADNTEGIVTPIVDWMSRDSRLIYENSNTVEINTAGFFVYCKEVITRILAEAGYEADYADNLPAFWHTIALACPITKFFEITQVENISFYAAVENNAAQTAINATERGEFQVVINDPTNLWDSGNNQWVMQEAGPLRIEFSGSYTHTETGTRPDSEIRIMVNGSPVSVLAVGGNEVDVPFYIFADLAIAANDVIYIEIESYVTQTSITIEPSAVFTIAREGVSSDRTVQPSEFIPQIGKSEFIANMLKLFNVVIVTDDIAKVVHFRNFNDIYTAQEQNLTDLLDVGFVEIEQEYSIDSLAQNSWFTWENDDLLRNDFDYVLRLNNQLLDKETTTISMLFSACDQSLLYLNNITNLKAKIPNCKLNYTAVQNTTMSIAADGSYTTSQDISVQPGMWVYQLQGSSSRYVYRVVAVTSPTSGVVQTPISVVTTDIPLIYVIEGEPVNPAPRLALMQQDGQSSAFRAVDGSYSQLASNATIFGANALSALWLDELKWENLANTYYQRLLQALAKPEVVKAWFNLPVAYFVELDFLRPVYIEEFNAFYYLNKVEQFKLQQKTRIELVRISTLTGD